MALPHAEHTYDKAMAALLLEFVSRKDRALDPRIIIQQGTFIPAATHRHDTILPHEIYRKRDNLPDEPLLFDVLHAGRSEWLRGDQCLRSRSDITAVALVIDGAGELVVGRRHYTLKPGDVFVLHTDERHVYRACSRTPFRKLFVAFNTTRPMHRRALMAAGLNAITHLHLEPEAAERVRADIECIIDVLRAAKPDSS
ncbi:hypothetical protein GX586_13465, partial [bacterium]|nr:hypothetical protein [bacterium]